MSIGLRSRLQLIQGEPRYRLTQKPPVRLDQMTAAEQAKFWNKRSVLDEVSRIVEMEREAKRQEALRELFR